MEALVRGLVAALPRGFWIRVVPGAGHFFVGALDDLGTACREAIAWEAARGSLPAPRGV